ncbi:DUF3613 domain-containing protein [Variovorax sp. EBFNA2]|uniref:DUF3613 domain-containing protein n=1 Tax=Variovorax sp. EBFNA2 TaxID=3342097 RepID=UPI0029BFD859|nr:DUF3613 domain-containing protein [Variovorax boronicumulans]WPG36898.1 DUF3613 domain-containing protein [Variovorax boronicumulans]
MNHNELAHRLSTLSACALATAFFFVTAAAAAQTASTSAPQGNAALSQTSAVTATGTAHAGPASPSQLAQDVPAAAEEQEAFDLLSPQVGDATLSLFAWQRSGEIASRTARPIAGAVAGRSYERYLKSFEFPIPERMSSTVKTSSGGK